MVKAPEDATDIAIIQVDRPIAGRKALALAEGFVHPGEYMCVILGDNIFEDSLKSAVVTYSGSVMHAEPN